MRQKLFYMMCQIYDDTFISHFMTSTSHLYKVPKSQKKKKKKKKKKKNNNPTHALKNNIRKQAYWNLDKYYLVAEKSKRKPI